METVMSKNNNTKEHLPGITNISGLSPFKGFNETDTGKTLIDNWQKSKTQKKWQILLLSILSVLVYSILYFFSHVINFEFFYFPIIICLAILLNNFIRKREEKLYTSYAENRRRYGHKIGNYMLRRFNFEYRIFQTGELFIYSDDLCSLVWIDNGNIVNLI